MKTTLLRILTRLAFLVLALFTTAAEAAVFLDSSPNIYIGVRPSAGWRFAYSFRTKTTATVLKTITFTLSTTAATGAESMAVYLYSDSGGEPGAQLRSDTINIPALEKQRDQKQRDAKGPKTKKQRKTKGRTDSKEWACVAEANRSSPIR